MLNPIVLNRIAMSAFLLATFVSLRTSSAQPLPTDPSLTTGTLDNGLKYIVRQHANPPGRATMWIHLDTGSLNETDRQRGIAHYTEHMAFNGSANYPPGSLVPFFQSLGMTFGRDQNAFTSFEQTTYQLSLPDTKPETVGKGLLFFADVLHRLSFTTKEIDAERQIIQEERRRGLSGRQRTAFYVIEHSTPGSLYGQRITIGKEETINAVNQADFLDYYGKWYAASNATVLVIADSDPAVVVAQIKEKFSDAPKRAKPVPQELNVKAYDKSFAIVTSDPEIRSEQIRISHLEPARPAITTVPLFRDELVATLGERAMNRRLDDKVSKGGTSYLNAGVSMGNDSRAIYQTDLSARAAQGKWKSTLEEVALELQRARAFGFSNADIDDAKKQMVSGAERAVETEGTTPAGGLIARLNSEVDDGNSIMSPSQRLTLIKDLLPTITAKEVAARFATEFDPKAVAFVAILPSGGDVPSEAQLLDIGTRALAVKPTAEAEVTHATVLMPKLPTAGVVKESSEHAGSAVWSGWMGNNVRVHHRFMDDRKNQVSITISLYGGELLETAANRGITQAAQLAFSRPATERLSSSDIRELMTGKKVSVRGGGGGGGRGGRGGGGGGAGGPDAITLSISGSPEELETGFQLAHLLLTEPKIEAPAFAQFKTTMREALQEAVKNPMMMGMRTAASAPYPDSEPRTSQLTPEQVDKLTPEAAQAWLVKLIKESPIEVSIVGDLPREKAVELAAHYLGSLPSRDRAGTAIYASLRKIERPKGPRVIEKTLETPTQQAFVLSGFYGADETNVADVRALNMAARILSTRMVKEVREDAQLVYSISAGSRAATTFPGFGTFSAGAPTEPAKVPALIDKLASMYQKFAAEGPSDAELDVARKQTANTLTEQFKDPGFWSARLDQITFRGTSLDEIMNEQPAYQALTAKRIRETFAKYYSKDSSIVVSVKPITSAAPDQAPAPAVKK